MPQEKGRLFDFYCSPPNAQTDGETRSVNKVILSIKRSQPNRIERLIVDHFVQNGAGQTRKNVCRICTEAKIMYTRFWRKLSLVLDLYFLTLLSYEF